MRIDDILRASDMLGVLGRQIRVRLLNVSGSGCLIEGGQALEAGTVADLRLHIDGTEYGDGVRITRCHRIEGAGATFRMGAEFLWTTHPGDRSLRRVASRLVEMVERGSVDVDVDVRRPM
jgi:hypothetical protein